MIQSGEDLKNARIALGMSFEEMRKALRLGDRGSEYLRRIEKGTVDVSGPIALSVEAMLAREGIEL